MSEHEHTWIKSDRKHVEELTRSTQLRMEPSAAGSDKLKFNMNDTVCIKLTDVGKKILLDEHNKLNSELNNLLGEYTPPKEDDEGFSKWRLWTLFENFGQHIYMGCNAPFETNIYLDVKNAD